MFDRVALLPQNPSGALFASTVENEIAFGLESLGVEASEIGLRVRSAAASVGLSDRLAWAPHTLSGGQKQRLLLAAALAVRPAVLLLDEPFAQLDPEMTADLRSILARLAAAGVTIVVSEHRLGPVLADVSRVVVIEDGRIVRDGPPVRVLQDDLRRHGVNIPLPVRMGHELGISPVPLTLEALAARIPLGMPLPAEPARTPRFVAAVDGAAATDAPAVELSGASMTANGRVILHDVSTTLHAGETVAVLGRNGAGKTTLLKHLNGLRRARRGEIRILERPIARRPVSELAADVGFVFQNPNDQFFQPTVREELEVGPRALGAYDPDWLGELIERFALGPLLDRSPFRLSEGQKKRVTFAAALAARPQIVLLDEPATGQDERFREALVALVTSLADEGQTIVLATHDVELADDTAGRWLVLGQEQLLADGVPARLMRDVEAFYEAGLRPGGKSWLREILPLGGAGS
jgi:energy-coupling factor transport system ATP-binding protein